MQLKASATAYNTNNNAAKSIPRYALAIINEYDEMYPDNYEIIVEVVDSLLVNDDYIAEYNININSTEKTMRNTLDMIFMEPMLRTRGANYAGLFYADYTVPVVEQSETNYCGPAAVVQALIGDGVLANTISNKSGSAQDTHAEAMETNKTGTRAFQIKRRLNSYFTDSPYETYNNTSLTNRYTMLARMEACFIDGRCPVKSLEDTAGLNYYNNESFGHCVTVREINDLNQTITLVEPHFESEYRGVHTVTYDEFFDALGIINGWVIC